MDDDGLTRVAFGYTLKCAGGTSFGYKLAVSLPICWFVVYFFRYVIPMLGTLSCSPFNAEEMSMNASMVAALG